MPFVDADMNRLKTVELGQVPITVGTFQLRSRIGYYELTEADVTWAPVHVPADRPGPGARTDLASVPAIFWSLIASYGRQTAPAVIHDAECWRVRAAVAAGTMTNGAALVERIHIDRRFRLGLRELEVAPFRSWLMWTFVAFERYEKHSIPKFLAMLVLAAIGIAGVVFAPIAWFVFGMPVWVVLGSAALPIATSAFAGQSWRLLAWAGYLGALLLPVAILQVAAYLPYAAIENLVWFFVDWLPHRNGSPTIGPVDAKNIKRASAS